MCDPAPVTRSRGLRGALTANADLIVTGDRKHLLPLCSYQGIRIVTPTEALQLISSG